MAALLEDRDDDLELLLLEEEDRLEDDREDELLDDEDELLEVDADDLEVLEDLELLDDEEVFEEEEVLIEIPFFSPQDLILSARASSRPSSIESLRPSSIAQKSSSPSSPQ